MRKHLITLMLATTVSMMALTGCGESSTPAEEPVIEEPQESGDVTEETDEPEVAEEPQDWEEDSGTIDVVDYGTYPVWRDDDDIELTVCVRIANNNDVAYENLPITFTFYTEDESVIDTVQLYAGYVYPNEVVAVDESITLPISRFMEARHVGVRIEDGKKAPDLAEPKQSDFEVTGVNASKEFDWTIRGTVHNNSEYTAEMANIVILCYKDGEVTAATHDIMRSDIPAGGEKTFEAYIPSMAKGEWDDFEVYVSSMHIF